MEYRQLGRSGLRVSKLCLGAMRGFGQKADEKEAAGIIHEAIDSGINFIDTADCYGKSEEIIGNALSQSGKREKVVLATKFGWYMGDGANDYGSSRTHIVESCENSLRRLKTDYIDLFLLHVVDPNVPFEETLRALDDLVRQGKVRYTGTTKHPITLIMEGLFVSEINRLERFVNEQTVYNLLDRRAENELIPTCSRHGVGITMMMPLGGGLLSGKRTFDKKTRDAVFNEAAFDAIAKFSAIANEKGISLAELSVAWLMQNPAISSVCLGARTIEYLRSGIKACDVSFTQEELTRIDQIVPPGSYVSNFFEATVQRPMRIGYAAAAWNTPGVGAFISKGQCASTEQIKRMGKP